MVRTIFHIDVNSAFLSWEAAHRMSSGEDIDIRDIPSAVAGDPNKRRGVILAKSTSAKRYGINTGESLNAALKKCPGLKVVSPTPGIYKRYSNALMDLIYEYTDAVEQCSIDEAFMDVSGIVKKLGVPPVKLADGIRRRVQNELGFTVNIGISCNKLLAKAASELEKPNRTHTMYPDEIEYKYWTLPVREMNGVGSSAQKKLNRAAIKTIGDLAVANEIYLKSIFKSYGAVLHQKANGIDESPVEPRGEAKSIGNSTTTPRDVESIEEACKYLLKLSENVGRRLRQKKLVSHCIGIEIRYSDFRNVQMQSALHSPVEGDLEIYQNAKSLFEKLWEKRPVRHIGIRALQLESGNEQQMSFLEEGNCGEGKLDSVIDNIRLRYGDDIIKRMV
ncbi:DNA polymerase-4 [Peptoclostridium litorale DSM 5388]|uniref:DNA polymerase IV n=1 Tax=Peptoclostridium litorale DSM 5388 TaxID=1121324 RepID=A0A069RR95_PEPLI|nr:DNA polymerase IV [Peptoclostridium litorale]KDR96697.1 DNA polymerase IV [Peptoclostridium litorale DSM 5388]SIN67630.1 DNA polymerase-4 [Peptoclostridium litorale DSM 5388]